MRKNLLIVILVIAAFWLASQRYSVEMGKSVAGKYSVVLIDKKSGTIHKVIGN